MVAVYASTSPSWFAHLQIHAPILNQVAFWRPTDKRASKIKPGEPWFFKQWGAPRVLGYGRFVEHQSTTPLRIWEEFGPGSGAADLDSLLASIKAARGADRPTSATTEIGNVVLSHFTAFDPPLALTDLSLPNLPVPFRYVPEGSPLLRYAAGAAILPRIVMTDANRRELITETFARNNAHVDYVRGLYGGRCQVTGEPVLDGIGGDLTQVHHIDFLCNGGADHPSNMICLSPNWHALAHAEGTRFDWSNLTFVVADRRFGLTLNQHLVPK